MAAAAWATEPGASHLAIFTFAVLLGGYTAVSYTHLVREYFDLQTATEPGIRHKLYS